MARIFLVLLAVVALMYGIYTYAQAAGCTLGVKDCRQGQLWVCEPCGSETCWIFKGTKCK